jgi:hypothetical protein
MKKILGYVAMIVVAVAGYVGWTWYSFAAVTPIDPQRGVYGSDDLELWIDLNVMMPGPMRRWACETLRAREREALGGQNSLPPYGCHPDFDPNAKVDIVASMIEANLNNTEYLAKRKNATTQQIEEAKTCVRAKLTAGITDDLRAQLTAEIPEGDSIIVLSQMASKADEECLAAAGL